MAAGTRTRPAARVIAVTLVVVAVMASGASTARSSTAATNAAAARAAGGAVAPAWTIEPYRGLGTWVDVYDWSIAYGGGHIGPDDVDRMAADGVQTLYIQGARADDADGVLERDRLLSIIDRAHSHNIAVVAWYLPFLDDVANDMRHFTAIAQLPIDGLGVDMESTIVSDAALRSQRMLDESAQLRAQLPGKVLSAIVLPPVILDDLNPSYWLNFPWQGLAAYYDVWQPMSYFTYRSVSSGWRDAYAYTAADIDGIRRHLGDPNAPVHTIGGLGELMTTDDVTGMVAAARDQHAIGGSVYDFATTGDGLWPGLQAFATVSMPFGSLDTVRNEPGGLRVAGWAIDPDTTQPIDVHVYVNGVGFPLGPANVPRPDVGNVYPYFGPAHGFNAFVPWSTPGPTTVCAYGINAGGNAPNAQLGCTTFDNGGPIGSLDSVEYAKGGLRVRGWALDPDDASSIAVNLSVNGSVFPLGTANLARSDVAAAFPGYGANHGFDAFVPWSANASLAVCAIGLNVGPPHVNTTVGCRPFARTGSPFGSLDTATLAPGGVRVSGWTVDPDTTQPIDVHVYVDGAGYALGQANGNRPDVGAAFPTFGSSHGFTAMLPAGPGWHAVCAYGINVAGGANQLVGCLPYFSNPSPFGFLDAASPVTGGIAVRGWTIDPDTAGPIDVHVYVDGVGYPLGPATVSRPDVAAAFPEFGNGHGFTANVPAPPGHHRVCAYGINVGPGTNSLLGCTST